MSLNFNEKLTRDGGKADWLILLLHGLGADGTDLIGLADYFAQTCPTAAFISPDAHQPCDMAPYGRQWFSLQERSPAAMTKGLEEARPVIEEFISAQLARLDIAPERLILSGFSQGCMLSLYAGLRMSIKPRGILGFSGAMPVSPPQAGTDAPEIVLVHGVEDAVVPVSATQLADNQLKEMGYTVSTHILPGLPHGIDERAIHIGMETLKRWCTE